ncbi:MAG: ComF family protein [Gammaproteobacteria bacterium]|nr:ComF family protein [Gammaproteobacteria bacterium]
MALSAYRPPISTLIQRFKYEQNPILLSWIWQNRQWFIEALQECDAIAPVPTDDCTLKSRQHDHCYRIAHLISVITDKPLVCVLARSGEQRLTTLNRRQRRSIVKKQYQKTGYTSGRICLIDDVVTTGATVARCTELLLAAGADSVNVVCLCRTPSR